jgi:glutamyl aminopeptidase
MSIDRQLFGLLKLNGVSGHEKNIRKYVFNYLNNFPLYEKSKDNLGNLFFHKKINPLLPNVMVASHMDEIGFIVVGIRDNGLLELHNLGGVSRETLVSQELVLTTKDGSLVYGIVPSIPPHLKDFQNSSSSNITYFDVGATTKNEILDANISLGDQVTFPANFKYSFNKKAIISKAIDDRMGVVLTLNAAKELYNYDFPYNLIFCTTVQEEVGTRGAETASNIYKPIVFIAIDSSPLNDALDNASQVKLGNGYLLRMYDPSNIMQTGLLNEFIKLSKLNKIKYQHFISQGGTDAAKALIMNSGSLSTTIGIPARYIHSNASICYIDDLKSVSKMLEVFLKYLNTDSINLLLNYNR